MATRSGAPAAYARLECMSDRALRVGLVDDHPLILRGAVAALREHLPGLDPTPAATVHELLTQVDELDVVLLDVQLADDSDPAENVATLVERGWPVLLYTQEGRPGVLARCFRAGALGLVGKYEDPSVLASATVGAADGIPHLTPTWAAALEDDTASPVPDLAPRESQALALYAMGLPLKSVARRMGVSQVTVKEYLVRARRKYAAAGRPAVTKTDLYIRAVEDGHLPSPVPALRP